MILRESAMGSKEKNPIFKQSEVGLIPKDWAVKEIGEISSYINRGIAPKYSQEGFPVLNQKCVRNGKIEQVAIKFHDSKETFSKEKIVVKDDILINSTGVGTLGRAANVKSKISGVILVDSHVTIVRIDQTKADSWFVAYYLNSIQSRIENMGEGTSGQQELSRNLVKAIKIPFPSITEQKLIAQLLSHLDEKIELNQQMNKTLEAVGQAVFKHWFVDFEFPNPEGKPYKSSGGEMIYNSALDKEIPEGWKVKPIDEIADFLNGLALQKFPARDGEEYLPVIKIRELRQGITESSDKANLDLPKEYIVKNGDVLFSWSGSLEVVIWGFGKGALNQHLFKVTSSKYPKWFFYYWILQFLPEYRQIAAGKATTMGHIQRHHLTASKVTIPNDKTIERINIVLAPILERIVHLKVETRTLVAIRDLLLPRLMSGKIRVTLPNEKQETN
jgi:type I restriction enzyme S subunit